MRPSLPMAGRGWPAILLLGVAYGLVEEGLTLQSLTSSTIYPAMAGLAPRVAGVNVAYTVMVLTYHAVISIAIPIKDTVVTTLKAVLSATPASAPPETI